MNSIRGATFKNPGPRPKSEDRNNRYAMTYPSNRRTFTTILRSIAKIESASVLVMTAVSLVVILGMMGLAIDVGQLRLAKQKLQMAADAAALAGALELSTCGGTARCSAMTNAAQTSLTENGFTGSTLQGTCVPSGSMLALSVNNGPCALGSQDPNHGDASYVEALVSQNQPTYFAGILGIHSVNIVTRAEAAAGKSPGCMFINDPTGTALQINGGSLNMQCGIMDNSSAASAFEANGGTITAPVINVHGGAQINQATINGIVNTSVPSMPDPLAGTPAPSLGQCYDNGAIAAANGDATFNPGTYCQGMQINSGTVTFNPGVYIVSGGYMQINNGALVGNGVTFYFVNGGAIQINNPVSVNLVAPTTGTYAGILFFQDPGDRQAAQLNGDSSAVFQGALYFPTATLQINGGDVAEYTIIDAGLVQMNSAAVYSLNNNYSSLPAGSPVKSTSAVLIQ